MSHMAEPDPTKRASPLATLAAPGRLVAPNLTSSLSAAVQRWARATKMSPTPSLFSLPEARSRFTVSRGGRERAAEGRGSDLALFFPLSLAENFPGTEGFSPPGPLLAPSGTDIKGKAHWLRVCGSSSAPPLASHETLGPCRLLAGEHGKLTHRLAQSAYLLAGRSRFLGQEP